MLPPTLKNLPTGWLELIDELGIYDRYIDQQLKVLAWDNPKLDGKILAKQVLQATTPELFAEQLRKEMIEEFPDDIDDAERTKRLYNINVRRQTKVTRKQNLVIGDHIRIRRPIAGELLGYWHHGIVWKSNEVVHYSGEPLRMTDAEIRVTTLSKFCDGDGAPEVVIHTKKSDPNEILYRAKRRLGERDYCPITNNCEHFANQCVEGVPKSDQVRNVVIAAAGGALAMVLGYSIYNKPKNI